MAGITNSSYRGVKIYALFESVNYHLVDENGRPETGAHSYDEDPQLIGWNLFGYDGMIDHPHLGIGKDMCTIEHIKKFIDDEVHKLNLKGEK